MAKEMPKLARIADCVRAAAFHPGSLLPGPTHRSLPIPLPGANELRIAFLFCRAEIRPERDGLALAAPEYVAHFHAETARFLELHGVEPIGGGAGAPAGGWLGTIPTLPDRLAPKYVEHQVQLYECYERLCPSFASGDPRRSAEVQEAARAFPSLFAELAEEPLAPYYRHYAKAFLRWVSEAARG